MRYRLKKDIKALWLKKGDIFDFNKEGYVHEYMDDNWIGLPKSVVEDNRDYFELCSKDREQSDQVNQILAEIADNLEQLRQRL